MSIFLFLSFPLYLSIVVFSSVATQVRIVRIVRYVLVGIFSYIPVYLLSRTIPDFDFFPWNIFQVFIHQLLESREAFSRFFAVLLLFLLILRRYRRNGLANRQIRCGSTPARFQWIAIHSSELLCWLTGYFFAGNFHDFMLLGSAPSQRELFFQPISRILFSQFLVFSLESLQLLRHSRVKVRQQAQHTCAAYLALAFILLNIVSSIAMVLNAYWSGSLVLLGVLFLYYFYTYQFAMINPSANSRHSRSG